MASSAPSIPGECCDPCKAFVRHTTPQRRAGPRIPNHCPLWGTVLEAQILAH